MQTFEWKGQVQEGGVFCRAMKYSCSTRTSKTERALNSALHHEEHYAVYHSADKLSRNEYLKGRKWRKSLKPFNPNRTNVLLCVCNSLWSQFLHLNVAKMKEKRFPWLCLQNPTTSKPIFMWNPKIRRKPFHFTHSHLFVQLYRLPMIEVEVGELVGAPNSKALAENGITVVIVNKYRHLFIFCFLHCQSGSALKYGTFESLVSISNVLTNTCTQRQILVCFKLVPRQKAEK